jgi:hypothetical protein
MFIDSIFAIIVTNDFPQHYGKVVELTDCTVVQDENGYFVNLYGTKPNLMHEDYPIWFREEDIVILDHDLELFDAIFGNE